jgi:hypothetical protein
LQLAVGLLVLSSTASCPWGNKTGRFAPSWCLGNSRDPEPTCAEQQVSRHLRAWGGRSKNGGSMKFTASVLGGSGTYPQSMKEWNCRAFSCKRSGLLTCEPFHHVVSWFSIYGLEESSASCWLWDLMGVLLVSQYLLSSGSLGSGI